MSRSRLEAWMGAGILGAVVLLGIGLSLASSGMQSEVDDAISSLRENGRRALWLTLAELGFQPRRWDASPSQLPRGGSLLWLATVPTETMPAGGVPGSDTGRGMTRFGMHGLEHYAAFVEGGGTLLMRAGEDTLEFLVDDLGFAACEPLVLEPWGTRESGPRSCRIRTSLGEDLEVDIAGGRLFEPLDPNGAARTLWSATCAEGPARPFLVEVPQGAGSIVLVADDRFVRNGTLGERDHAVAAVRLVEEVLGSGELLLDEYELGNWTPPSVIALALSPRLLLVSLHVGGFLMLFVWMLAFARAFPRDPEALELFSPLLRARSLGGVLARAGRFGVLATMLRRGMYARLARQLHLRASGARTDHAADAGDAQAPHGGDVALTDPAGMMQPVTPQEVAALVRAAGAAEHAQELERVFVSRPVRTRADLAALDRELVRAAALVMPAGERAARSRARTRHTVPASD